MIAQSQRPKGPDQIMYMSWEQICCNESALENTMEAGSVW